MNGDKKQLSFSDGITPDGTIAGKDLGFYWRLTRLVILLLLILEIVIIVFFDKYPYIHWIIEGLGLILISWVLLKNYQVKITSIMAAGGFLGFILGLLIAIFEIIWYHKWWYFLELISRPIWMGFSGIAFCLVVSLILNIFIEKKQLK
jgi:hypothetical protein